MALPHYSEDFQMASPYISQIAGKPSGMLKGKAAIRDYWSAALLRMPILRFELVQTLIGADSIAIYNRGVRGMATEVFFFDNGGLVHRAAAHYE